jgi:hypothetical protein
MNGNIKGLNVLFEIELPHLQLNDQALMRNLLYKYSMHKAQATN